MVQVDTERLDAAVAEAFKKRIIAIADAGSSRLLLDLSAVRFMDSSGLGAVVGVFKHVEKRGTLEIACPTAPVRKVFSLTRMDRVFVIHDELPETGSADGRQTG